MVDDIFLERVTCLIGIIDTGVYIAGVDFAAAFVDRHKHGFYARSGAGHQADSASWGYGQTCYVAPAVLHHAVVDGWLGFAYAVDKRIAGFACCVVYFESTALGGEVDRRAVGGQCQCTMD